MEENLSTDATKYPVHEIEPEEMAPPAKPEHVIEDSSAVRAGEHPLLAPYFKMLRVGVPEHSIRTKMARDGFDPAILDDQEAMVAAEMEDDNSTATTEDESIEFSE